MNEAGVTVPTVWRSGKGTTVETVQRPEFARGGGGTDGGQSPEDFRAVTVPWDTVAVDAHHYPSV